MSERISKIVADALTDERQAIQKERVSLTRQIAQAEKTIAEHQTLIADASAKLEALDTDVAEIEKRMSDDEAARRKAL